MVSCQIHRHTNLHNDLPSCCRIHWSRNSRISHPRPCSSAPLLSAITGRHLAAEGDGKHLRKPVCVRMVEYTRQKNNCVFYVFLSCFWRQFFLHGSRLVYYSNMELAVQWMKYECRYNMQTFLVFTRLQGWCFRIDYASLLADKWAGASGNTNHDNGLP